MGPMLKKVFFRWGRHQYKIAIREAPQYTKRANYTVGHYVPIFLLANLIKKLIKDFQTHMFKTVPLHIDHLLDTLNGLTVIQGS